MLCLGSIYPGSVSTLHPRRPKTPVLPSIAATPLHALPHLGEKLAEVDVIVDRRARDEHLVTGTSLSNRTTTVRSGSTTKHGTHRATCLPVRPCRSGPTARTSYAPGAPIALGDPEKAHFLADHPRALRCFFTVRCMPIELLGSYEALGFFEKSLDITERSV